MEQRLIDANAYAAEMKVRQDACKEIMDAAKEDDNWELYAHMSAKFSIFAEAKLTLDKQPTVDAVPVVHCVDCKHSKQVNGQVNGQVVKLVWCDHLAEVGAWVQNDFYCADGERKSND
jgi:hypothetical protein